MELRYLRKNDDLLMKSSTDQFNYVMIPVPVPVPDEPDESIDVTYFMSKIIESKLLDESMDDMVLKPEDQADHPDLISETMTESITIPIKNISLIKNSPEILIIGLKRHIIGYDDEEKKVVHLFNNTDITLDDIDINEELYIPISYVIYDCINRHYTAITKDLLNQKYYWHDDGEVCKVTEDDFLDQTDNIVMAFYIKLSSWTEKKEGFVHMVQNGLDYHGLFDENRKRSLSVLQSPSKKPNPVNNHIS